MLLVAAVLAACGEGYWAVGSDGFYYEGNFQNLDTVNY